MGAEGAERWGLASWHVSLATCHAASPGSEGRGCVCREGGEASISLRLHSPIAGLFPLSSGSPVCFHPPELAVLFLFLFYYIVLRGPFFY